MDDSAIGEKRLPETEDRESPGGVAEEEVGRAQVGAEPAPDAAAAEVGGSGEILDAREGDAAEGVVQAQEGGGGEVVEVRQRDAGGDEVVSDVAWAEATMDPSLSYDQQAARNGVAQRNVPPTAVESDEDADLFVEVEQQELAGSDQSEEFFHNAVATVTGESVAAECEEIEDDRPAEIGVEDDAHDEHRERLEEEAMLEAIRQCVTDAVLAEHLDDEPEKGREDVPACDSNPELPMNSSEPEQVQEAMLVDQNKEQPEYSKGDTAARDSKFVVPTQSGGEPDVVVEELDDSNSSDDENKASSAPARSSSAAAGQANGPSVLSRPAGLGSSSSLLPPPRPVQQVRANGPVAVDRDARQDTESAGDDGDENDEIREKLQMIRVKFLRLANRFGQTPHNMVVSQVLYRLGLAEQIRRNGRGVFNFDRAQEMAERLEAAGNEPLDLSCTILVLGKTGVGKSATINSIFDDVKLETDAFESSTRKVQEVVGMVEGIKVKVIDTPGLSSSSSDQHYNQKVLNSVKKIVSKNPPDIVLYFDRLDLQSRDYGDVPLLQTISKVFGASVWFNAIVVLTHAASAPPDGPNGIPLSYEMFVTQRSHVVQQAIRQAAADVRLMNPVALVENHSACRTNRSGQRVLPNGQVWKPQLLLLCFASKVLAEANSFLKLQDSPAGKTSSTRVAPLPFLLSSLLQSRAPLKLPEEQFGDDDDLEDDLADDYGSDDGSDYDDLPPFKRLTKAQLSKLNHAQRKAYLEELDYREKLFYKKQLKEEHMRRKMMKKMAAEARAREDDFGNNNVDDDVSTPTNVAVPMPDMVLPSTFDSDYPSHRYRFLDTPSEWLVRPVLETQGWDHDVGYEGVNVERLFAVKGKVPLSVSGQLTKDKKDSSLQMEVASSVKHGEGKTSSVGLDLQSVGKDMAYTIRGESRFKNFRRNNTAAGISATLLGDTLSAGLKIEDRLIVNKQLRLLVSGGTMSGKGDAAYGGRLEATLRDKDYPIGRMLSTLAISVVDWHGDLAVGCNAQSQIPAGRSSNLIASLNLSNKGTGQVGIRLNSSEHLQIALLALVPIFKNIWKLLDNYYESA
ncbi:translocase of chloroplast 101, chloroplastic [Triticum aestivum]|uniref:translocase of chloroplast 101, chloroplastic n=1 Tax=Triticum aestivum TaxID=4565 RepID=UPI001D029EAA|nr:translocase of chloroplast 101, chloroplastic-like [Triticum aestivum]